jgi:hypothetical protein
MSGTTARTSGLPPSVSLRQTRSTPNQIRPENCTCGAKLAENARFCHLCGRPVFEPEIPEAAEAPPVPQTAIPQMAFVQAGAVPGSRGGLAQLPVSFSNPIALRVAFLMSLGVMLMTMIPVLYVLSPIWWLVAGLCGVLLYRRLTGVSLSVRAGARLGSITGVLAFLSLVVIIALTAVFAGKDLFQEMVKQNPDVSQVLNNPPALAVGVGMFLVFLFAVVVGTCAAGGALGARFAGRNAKV